MIALIQDLEVFGLLHATELMQRMQRALTTGGRHRLRLAFHGLQVLLQLLEEAAELRLVPANQMMTIGELLLTLGLPLLGKVAVTNRDQVDRLPLHPRQPILGM